MIVISIKTKNGNYMIVFIKMIFCTVVLESVSSIANLTLQSTKIGPSWVKWFYCHCEVFFLFLFLIHSKIITQAKNHYGYLMISFSSRKREYPPPKLVVAQDYSLTFPITVTTNLIP